MNPFFLLWSILPIARGKASDLWQTNQFNTQGEMQNTITQALSGNEKLLIKLLKDKIGDVVNSETKIFECAEGHGRNAVILSKGLGITPSCYYGMDLHPDRVAETDGILRCLDDAANINEQGANPIFACDILSDQGAHMMCAKGSMDIVFFASFTCTFDDKELRKALSVISDLNAIYIVDVHDTTSWGLSVGRIDPTVFYNDIGYKLHAWKYETPSLSCHEAYKLWFPNKYWTNRIIRIYRAVE